MSCSTVVVSTVKTFQWLCVLPTSKGLCFHIHMMVCVCVLRGTVQGVFLPLTW